MANSFLSGMLAGLFGVFGLGGPAKKPPSPRQVAPPTVSAPVVASATGAVRGTMVLIHGGAWRGPDAKFQRDLIERPGTLAVRRGWRVVSVDYKAGQAGLQDVLDAIGQELLRPSGRLLCIYGESAGGHLALVAAARLPSVDCVIAAGAPTDFRSYFDHASSGPGDLLPYVATTLREVFGDSPEGTAPWDPVRIARDIDADVLLLRQVGDPIIPPNQVTNFRAVRPSTEALELEPGDSADPGQTWVHGSLSAAGQNRFANGVAAFTDRASAAHGVARSAARTRCKGVNRRLARTGSKPFRQALRCLARSQRSTARPPAARRATTTRMRGEVTPARAWAALRSTRSGRAQLAGLAAGRARATVRGGNPSRLVVRPR